MISVSRPDPPSTHQDGTAILQAGGIVASTLSARWLIAGGVIASGLWLQPRYIWVSAALLLIYTVGLQLASMYHVANRWVSCGVLLADYAILTFLLLGTGGSHSPFLILLAAPLVTVGYWRRMKTVGLLVCLALLSMAVLAVLVYWSPLPVVAYEALYGTVAQGMALVALGVLVYNLSGTEREERNRALRAQQLAELQEARLIVFLNSISESVLVVDMQGKITLHNAAALQLFDTHNLEGKPIDEVMKIVDDKGVVINMFELGRAASRPIERDDLHLMSSDGSRLTLGTSIAPVYSNFDGSSSHPIAYVLVMRDITKTKNIEQERKEFIATASHELRTPVATAEASLSMLMNSRVNQLDPRGRHFAELAHENMVFLGELIADLTTLSQLERNALDVDVKEVSPQALLRHLHETFIQEATAKGLTLQVVVDPELPAVLSNEHLIKEIMQNFITNAIKYTTKGVVTLSAVRSVAPDTGITFSVKDTGIGISTSDKTQLFRKFFRSEDYRTRMTGGTGLGLYLCNQLAQRLNGRVWFTSKLNEGSTFYVSVPPASHLAQDRQKVNDARLNKVVNSL